MQTEVQYQRWLDDQVSANADRSVAWPALLESLPSVYPACVRESALRLNLWGNVLQTNGPLEASPKGSIALGQWLRRELPTGHPLDSCWWFADQTLKELARCVGQMSAPGQVVALLGAPTLFHHLKEEYSNRKLFLVDRHVCVKTSNSQNIIQVDLLRERLRLPRAAAVVVVDPPWYEAELRGFLWSARVNSIRGTKVILSTPPIGTRPDIDREWEALTSWCEGIGFRVLERRALCLRYLSPAFEMNALQAEHVPECPLDWRRGDMIILECVDDRVPLPLAPKQTVNPSWIDFCIGRVRFKIRLSSANNSNISSLLHEIVPNDVLPSVSRRDSRVKDVMLWTSGNRVFGSNNGSQLFHVVKHIALGGFASCAPVNQNGKGCDDNQGERQFGLVVKKLRKIIEIEETELEEWSRKLNANMVQLAS